eukprot:2185413-Pyramimonas_sp.AAC.1
MEAHRKWKSAHTAHQVNRHGYTIKHGHFLTPTTTQGQAARTRATVERALGARICRQEGRAEKRRLRAHATLSGATCAARS